MKKLNQELLIGASTALVVFVIFFASQLSFAQSYNKKLDVKADSINRQEILKLNNEVIQRLELKVDSMSKYVEISQKNLDSWLKLLAIILSLVIGLSVFTGLKSREQAKEELAEIKAIKGEIQRVANETEDRLVHIKTQITQIEGDAEKAKAIKNELTEALNGIEFRTDVVLSEITTKKDFALNSAQNKIIEDSIIKTKEELQKSGIESIKNLYYAKALKAQSEKKWEEVIRLINSYSDFEENNPSALEIWTYSLLQLFIITHDKEFLKKALIKVDELIKIHPDTWAFDMKGNIYFYQEDYTNATLSLTQAITIDSKFARGYYNRSLTYKKMGKLTEANADMIIAKEIDPKVAEAL